MIEKSTIIETDSTTISRIAHNNSISATAKIDSIIIEEYAADDRGSEQTTEGHNKPGHKVSPCQKRNATSQSKPGSMKKKTKIYGANLSGIWFSANYTLNKKMAHQQTTNSEIKQKTPIQTTARSKIIYVIVGITILLFAGYVVWKNAVQ